MYRGRGQSAAAKGPLREFGTDPVSERPVVARDGRFGVYVTDGETNASIGQGDRIEDMAPERAYELLAVRREQVAAKGGPAKKAAAKRSPAKKTAAKKAAAPQAPAGPPRARRRRVDRSPSVERRVRASDAGSDALRSRDVDRVGIVARFP